LWATLAVLVGITLLTAIPGAPLRNPDTGKVIGDSPFMDSLIVIIMIVFYVAGYAYGRGAGTIKGSDDVLKTITKSWAGLAGLLFLFLLIAQFIAYFNYSKIAEVLAVKLGDVLEHMDIGKVWLLIGVIIVSMIVDLIIPQAIAKWALLAPIFVPLMPPARRRAADRAGRLPRRRLAVNVLTPLMAYFPLIVIFAKRYRKDAGIGTVVSLMLPYAVILAILWTLFFVVWYLIGIPLGPARPSTPEAAGPPRRQPEKPEMASPTSFAPMRRNSTVMIVALLRAIQFLSPSSASRERSPSTRAAATGPSTPSDATRTNTARTAACSPDRSPSSALRRGGDREQQVLGVEHGEREAGTCGLQRGEVVQRAHPARSRRLLAGAGAPTPLLDRIRQEGEAQEQQQDVRPGRGLPVVGRVHAAGEQQHDGADRVEADEPSEHENHTLRPSVLGPHQEHGGDDRHREDRDGHRERQHLPEACAIDPAYCVGW
jgi:hypothetical protein